MNTRLPPHIHVLYLCSVFIRSSAQSGVRTEAQCFEMRAGHWFHVFVAQQASNLWAVAANEEGEYVGSSMHGLVVHLILMHVTDVCETEHMYRKCVRTLPRLHMHSQHPLCVMSAGGCHPQKWMCLRQRCWTLFSTAESRS